MFALMLIVVFVLVFFSVSFVVQFIDAVRNDDEFNAIAHAVIFGACITFIVGYFTY